jgi:hypothetical protein
MTRSLFSISSALLLTIAAYAGAMTTVAFPMAPATVQIA